MVKFSSFYWLLLWIFKSFLQIAVFFKKKELESSCELLNLSILYSEKLWNSKSFLKFSIVYLDNY